MHKLLAAIAIVIGILALGWAIWFVIELIRYVVSGDYEIDQRLRKVTH